MTIAQQLKITEFPFTIKDARGNKIYHEWSDGTWVKWEYADGKQIYCEHSNGYWEKREYADGKLIYRETSNGTWEKREYADGNLIYRETSDGIIVDKRPKTAVQKAIDLLTAEGLIVDGKILKRTSL